MNVSHFNDMLALLHAAGLAQPDIDWSENIKPPTDAEDFALEAIFVICNGGMRAKTARLIYDRVVAAIRAGKSARAGLNHTRKASAIDSIWSHRDGLYRDFMAQTTDADRLEYCGRIAHIGKITKFHLAKNCGVDVAKPDVHLQRLADLCGLTVQGMCEHLAKATGYRIATVDVLIWRACASGIMDSRSGAFR